MKKIIVFLLSLTITFTPSLVFASNSFWPWSLSNPVLQGASTVYTGTKEVVLNGAKKIATGTARITPVAADVAKLLGKGIGGVALTFAVEQLLGAVDWTLDPANNQIVYKEKPDLKKPWIPKVWTYSGNQDVGLYTTADDACHAMLKYSLSIYPSYEVVKYATYMNSNNTTATCYLYNIYGHLKDLYTLSYIDNPYYDPHAQEKDDKKTLSLDAVAEQVISNAESGDAKSQAVTSSAASQIVSDAEQDNVKARPIIDQLENSQSIPTDQTAKGDSKPQDTTNTNTNTAEPQNQAKPQDITLNFPVFCDWAPSVCLAAKEVIAFPKTLTNWWDKSTKSITESWTTFTDFMNWTKKEPDKSEKENVDIDTPVPFDTSIFTKDRFQVSRQCPVPEQHTITLSGISVNFAFDMTPLCRVLELARPALIACSYLYAAYIVIGASRNG